MSLQCVYFVRLLREHHGFDVMRLRICCDSVLTGLPYASGEIQSGLRVRNTVPVHQELVSKKPEYTIFVRKNMQLHTPPFCTASSCANLSASYKAELISSSTEGIFRKGVESHVRVPSLPAFLRDLKATQYHSRSSCAGSFNSDQLKASPYDLLAYLSSYGRK